METENFTPAEARKTIRFAAVCLLALILAFKFNFAEFWQFLVQMKWW